MAGVAGLNLSNEIKGCDTKQGKDNPNKSLANPKKCRTSKPARTIRRPVPQLSTCRDCGNDFSYMRTMRIKFYCDKCNIVRYDVKLKKWRENNACKSDPVRL